MTAEVDLKEIKSLLLELNGKIDKMIHDRESFSMMTLAERSLKKFLEEEPNIYSIKDLKVRYC